MGVCEGCGVCVGFVAGFVGGVGLWMGSVGVWSFWGVWDLRGVLECVQVSVRWQQQQ